MLKICINVVLDMIVKCHFTHNLIFLKRIRVNSVFNMNINRHEVLFLINFKCLNNTMTPVKKEFFNQKTSFDIEIALFLCLS